MMFGRGGVAAVEAVVAAAAAALTRTYAARAEDAVRWTMVAGGDLLSPLVLCLARTAGQSPALPLGALPELNRSSFVQLLLFMAVSIATSLDEFEEHYTALA